MKLYDTMFIPYSYQICVNGKVDLFANYLINIYKNLSDKKKIDRSELMRLSHVSKRAEFDEAIETLKEAGAVLEYKVKGATKPKTVYVYVPSPYTKLKFPEVDNSAYEENGFFELTEKPGIHEELKKEDDRPKEPTKEDTPSDSLKQFFNDNYEHMNKPETMTDAFFLLNQMVLKYQDAFKNTKEQSVLICKDYFNQRSWPIPIQQGNDKI